MLSLVLCSVSSHAQTWCPPGATWTYNAGLLLQGYQRLSYVGDTLIDSYVAQKIDRYFAAQYPQPPPGPLFSGPPELHYSPLVAITRVENDVVYIREETEWDTLFWIGAVPGDRWTAAHVTDPDCEPFIVSDTGTVMIDGVDVRYVEGANWPRVYERIGSIWDLYLYCPNWIIDGPTGLRCYQDDEMNYTMVQEPCELFAGINETGNDEWIQPFPNPGTDHFNLNNLEPGSTIHVLDAMGRTVLQQRAIGTSTNIDASKFATGVYQVHTGDRTMRWVKQ